MTDRRTPAAAALVLAVLVGLSALSVLAFGPPPAAPADAPVGEFSAARADTHLRAIAQRPHPLGTPDNARVRDYLVTTAQAAGAEVEVESGPVVVEDPGYPVTVAFPSNVVVRVPGTDPTASGGKALLLVSHYDSVPTGPGAADDGAAVAAMLETLQVLKATGGVRNDVVFLFTDGEELGLLGATKFVRDHGVGDFGAVLNWEARGSSGPVVMFETSPGNDGLVDAYAGASSRPVANSLAYEVYRRMPNGSDFTVFLDAGATGLNAAFIEGFHQYHSPNDDVDRVSRDSVQHHGESMTGLVRALGDRDLRELRGSNAVYFDLFARVLVHYPVWLAYALVALSVLAFAAFVVLGVRRGVLRIGGTLAVAGAGLGALVGTAVLCFAAWWLITVAAPDLVALPLSEPYDRGWFIAGFTVLAAAVLLVVAKLLRHRTRAELVAGGLLPLAVFVVVIAALVPGATYLLQWPLIAGLPALWWAVRREDDLTGLLLASVAPAVAAVLFAPVVSSLLIALGIAMAGAAMAIAVLAALLVLPLFAELPRPGLLAATAGVVVLALFATSVLVSGYDRDEPRPNGLLYLRDAGTGQTAWLSGDAEVDDWTSRVMGADPEQVSVEEDYPSLDEPVLRAQAPAVRLPEPTVTTLADTTLGDVRTIRFTVASARQAWKLQVAVPREGVRACEVGGTRVESVRAPAAKTVFEVYGAVTGVDFTCEVTAGTPLPVDVADFSIGLPADVAALVGPRPDGTVLVSSGFRPGDAAIVRQVVRL